MTVKILGKNDIGKLKNLVKSSFQVIVIKKFAEKKKCFELIKYCHTQSKKIKHGKKNKNGLFFTFDVMPLKGKTDRIFRMFNLGVKYCNNSKLVKDIYKLQQDYIQKNKKNKKIYRRTQVIHYPKGGGFFGEHHHPRYPTNYGIILTLSEKFNHFTQGVTNFKYRGKNINLESFNVTTGDLILFKYDLPHKITPCDPKEELIFNEKGRWALVVPLRH